MQLSLGDMDNVWTLPAVTGVDTEVPVQLLGLSRARLMPVLIFSNSSSSYLEMLSRKPLEVVFYEFSPSDICNGTVAVTGLPYVLRSQAQPRGASQASIALCKKPEAFEKHLSCTVILSGCRNVRFSIGIAHLGGKRTQVRGDAAAALLGAIKMP